MPGYWNAHSDRDWENDCGIHDSEEHAMDHHSDYLDRPSRSLDQLLAELQAQYDALPETHCAARGKLIARIRAVEAELAWRVEL